MESLASTYGAKKSQVWNFIRALVPEADAYNVSYNNDNCTLTLVDHHNLRSQLQDRMEKGGGLDAAGLKAILKICKAGLVSSMEFDLAGEVRNLEEVVDRTQAISDKENE